MRHCFAILLWGVITAAVSTSHSGATNYADKNVDLRFYGEAVDERGEVIPRARIKFNVRYYPDFAFSEQGFRVRRKITHSDATGRFFISTKGVRITIEKISKKGFTFGTDWSALSDQYHANGAIFPDELGFRSPARFIGESAP